MTRSQLIMGVAVAIAIAVVVIFFIYNPFTMTTSSTGDTGSAQLSNAAAPAGLVVQDVTVGTGATAAPGEVLSVNYTGKLSDGTVFDTSVGRAPFKFTLGAGQVIPGWDQGLVGMKVGGKRILIIPPDMAYGAQGAGPIPPNATLTFEVDLLGVSTSTATQ